VRQWLAAETTASFDDEQAVTAEDGTEQRDQA
jgi:hypothetical protein